MTAKLCCLVNWLRKCTGCDYIKCEECWCAARTSISGLAYRSTDHMHRDHSPNCHAQIWYKDRDGSLQLYDS